NVGPGLHAGDLFQLFSSSVSGFTMLSMPTTDFNGNTYTWTNRLAMDGSIQVLTAGPPIDPLPGKIQFSASDNTLSLSWPTNAGWLLQAQTNSSAIGLNTNWVTVPGSASVTATNLAINPTNAAVFYRLVSP
ncbi:MAG: Autotransporter-associated beta strand repeat protein, partial [Pedosphaera sp.]|nr:Autotransporter-associated beta strand repeat protein [Pedosphaera sp.]